MIAQKTNIDPRSKQIGDKIRQLRKKAGFSSAADFANAHKISRAQYGRFENGSNITMKTLFMIVDIHAISLKEFFSSLD